MSQAKKEAAPGDLARVIKTIRLRLGLSMAEFGKKLWVTQGQISRYEAGRGVPAYIPLGHLLELAEGTEKNPILDHLAACFRGPGSQMTETEALAEIAASRKRSAGWANAVVTQPVVGPPPFWAKFLGLTPNLAALLNLVSQLYDRKREVDASLVKILRLWLSFEDSDPAVKQCFADAAQYLNLMLLAKTGRGQPHSATGKYRVVLPVTFGDGALHQHGETVELDLETAKAYAHALLPVEEETASVKQVRSKKLA